MDILDMDKEYPAPLPHLPPTRPEPEIAFAGALLDHPAYAQTDIASSVARGPTFVERGAGNQNYRVRRVRLADAHDDAHPLDDSWKWWIREIATANFGWWLTLLMALAAVCLLVLNQSPDYCLGTAAIIYTIWLQGSAQTQAFKRQLPYALAACQGHFVTEKWNSKIFLISFTSGSSRAISYLTRTAKLHDLNPIKVFFMAPGLRKQTEILIDTIQKYVLSYQHMTTDERNKEGDPVLVLVSVRPADLPNDMNKPPLYPKHVSCWGEGWQNHEFWNGSGQCAELTLWLMVTKLWATFAVGIITKENISLVAGGPADLKRMFGEIAMSGSRRWHHTWTPDARPDAKMVSLIHALNKKTADAVSFPEAETLGDVLAKVPVFERIAIQAAIEGHEADAVAREAARQSVLQGENTTITASAVSATSASSPTTGVQGPTVLRL